VSESRSRHRNAAFPVIATVLVVLGVLLLLNNFGYLPWGIWGTLWRFWPMVLILVGINIFLSGSRPWLALFVTIVTVLAVLGLAFYVAGAGWALPGRVTGIVPGLRPV